MDLGLESMYTVGVAFRSGFSHKPIGRSKKKGQRTRSFNSFLLLTLHHIPLQPVGIDEGLLMVGLRLLVAQVLRLFYNDAFNFSPFL